MFDGVDRRAALDSSVTTTGDGARAGLAGIVGFSVAMPPAELTTGAGLFAPADVIGSDLEDERSEAPADVIGSDFGDEVLMPDGVAHPSTVAEAGALDGSAVSTIALLSASEASSASRVAAASA